MSRARNLVRREFKSFEIRKFAFDSFRRINFWTGFTVRLLGNHIKLAQLETQTMMILDPFPPLSTAVVRTDGDAKAKKCQYESIFMQLADENRYVAAPATMTKWASKQQKSEISRPRDTRPNEMKCILAISEQLTALNCKSCWTHVCRTITSKAVQA